MTEDEGSEERPVSEPATSTAEEILAKPEEGEGRDTARRQAEQILAESEERTEDPATLDPDDPTIERRRAEDIAE